MLLKCGGTALNSKLISGQKEFFSKMVVDAILHLEGDMDLKMIGMKKVPGGSVTDSFLVEGVAFKKTFSYAGFEQQPKVLQQPQDLCSQCGVGAEGRAFQCRDPHRQSL